MLLTILLYVSNEALNFCLGAMVSGIIVHCICSGYANITSIIEENSKSAKRDADFWLSYYNKEQEKFFEDN